MISLNLVLRCTQICQEYRIHNDILQLRIELHEKNEIRTTFEKTEHEC